MSETFRIKPMQWDDLSRLRGVATSASISRNFGTLYTVHKGVAGWTCLKEGHRLDFKQYESLEAGKTACEEDWRRHLLACLEPVEKMKA